MAGVASLSVCLLLDDEAERAVRRLWDRLEDDGVRTLATYTHGRHVPHLTLADVGVAPLDEVLDDVVARSLPTTPIPVVFGAIGTFTRTRCSLLPAVSPPLLDRQSATVDALLGTGLPVGPHYRPGSWLPHLTLGPRLPAEALPQVARRCYEVLPLAATLERTVVIDTTSGEMHPL
jgi:hypothetical protein